MVFPVYENFQVDGDKEVQVCGSGSGGSRLLRPRPQLYYELQEQTSQSSPRVNKDQTFLYNLPGHLGRVNKVFNPMRYVLLLVGRFPFVPFSKDPSYFPKRRMNRRYPEEFGGQECDITSPYGKNYSASIKSWAWLYFGITSSFLLFLLAITIGSFLAVFLAWEAVAIPTWTCSHKKLFNDNLIPFVLVWSCLLSSTTGNISFLLNRKNVVKFLNYSNVAVDLMNVDIPPTLKRFVHMNHCCFLVFVVMVMISTLVLKIQLASEGSLLMGLLVLRIIDADIDPENWICRCFGMLIIVYALYASRAMLFFFVFNCKLLRHCIKTWNSRLRIQLQRDDLSAPASPSRSRVTENEAIYGKLFDDHVVLLQLIKVMNKVFAAILLSYFGSQILNMCFELYYVTVSNALSNGDSLNTLVAILLLIQNIYVFLSVSLHAAYVAEEANKGFEIVKMTGLRETDSVARRNLLLSLHISFQQRMSLSGGHYFAVEKPFIVSVLGAVFTYFIIILQYGNETISFTFRDEECDPTNDTVLLVV